MGEPEAICVVRVQLFQFVEETGAYDDRGHVGCAIMGTVGSAYSCMYKLGCYDDLGDYICTAPITANNEAGARIALQGNGYVSFRDEAGLMWSMLFPNENEAIDFGASVAIATYAVANQPEANVVAYDCTEGKKPRPVYSGDRVKVRFQSWVFTRGGPGAAVARLGSRLESNENDDKPHVFDVPANHLSVSNTMKGYEGMVVGMCEEGRRFVVIPQGARRGSGPNVHACFLVHVIKKKDAEPGENKPSTPQAQPAQPQQQPGAAPLQPVAGALVAYDQFGQPVAVQQPGQQLVVAEPPRKEPAAPRVPTPPPPPPPGFNNEQLAMVDRLRDQVGSLQQQLKEATMKLDLFNNDFKSHNSKQKPQSLAAAQVEFSVQKMLQETDERREELSKRDEMLRQLEAKNTDLQKKVDRFSSTANQLAEEKKSALTNNAEERIGQDQQLATLQAQLTRIMSEREDVARHLSTVKRLLEVSDTDMKSEKGKLQVAQVQMQTNEAKMVTTEERLTEENGRRKLLEGKCTSLGSQLRDNQEEIRTKESQIEERKRKMDADKLHYTQLMDTERNQAATELRDLRQELVEELGIRERRYQEERQRVAAESFERGKGAGVDNGYSDETLAADAKIQELQLSVQRSNSEVEGIKIRLRQASETAESDQRRLNAQIAALSRVVDDLTAQNNTTSVEIDAQEIAKESIEQQTFDTIVGSLRRLTRHVGRRDLMTIIHQLRVKQDVDFTFEAKREEEEGDRVDQERKEVYAWVKEAVRNKDGVMPMCPAMRTKAAPITAAETERALAANSTGAANDSAASSALVEAQLRNLEGDTDESLAALADQQREELEKQRAEEDEAVTARYKELLQQIGEEDPSLGLVKPKEPTPPPTPPREPTPEPEPVPEPVKEEPAPVEEEPVPTAAAPEQEGEAATPEPASKEPSPAQQLPNLDDSDEEEVAPTPANTPAVAAKSRPIPDDSDEEEEQPPKKPAPKAAKGGFDDSDDEEEPVRKPAPKAAKPAASGFDSSDEDEKPAPKAAAPAPKKQTFDDSDEEEAPPAPKPAPKQPSPPAKTFDDSEEEEVKPAAKPTKSASPAAAKKKTMFDDSDDEEDAAPAKTAASPQAAKPAPPKRAAPATKGKAMFDDDSDDSDEAPAAAPKKAAASAPATKAASGGAATKKKSMFDDSDDSDDDDGFSAPKRKPAAAPKKAAAKSRVAPKKSMFGDSESD